MEKQLIIVFLLSFFVFSFYTTIELILPSTFNREEIEIHVSEGFTFKKVLNELNKHGLKRDNNLFNYLGVFTGVDKKLKAGYYIFNNGESPLEILTKLLHGDSVEFSITIVPGSTLWDISTIFEMNNIMTKEEFFKIAYDKDFLDLLNIRSPSFEGYIFPDTYRFHKGISPEKVIMAMINSLRKQLPDDFKAKVNILGMNENQVLTLASIIEKEAKLDSERIIISAVFHNRLRKGLPLQSDPTSIYGIKDYREGVTSSDLRNKTPYNTYKFVGLPPGPIALPSKESIVAAINPENISYLYFVSRNDGTHHFSKTFKEHINAVKRYRRK